MNPAFTVLLPVHRPPALLPYALESVLAQERRDFELMVICDGAPQATVDCARAFAARDQRIQVHAHPKGERNGERYRHLALEQARGACVCQIADDDLWLPNHLGEIERLLREFEFGNLSSIHVHPDGRLHFVKGDLGAAADREAMRTRRYNFFGPSNSAYRLATYRRLPEGWAPAPPDIWTDLHMWRKFLALPDLACGTRGVFTCVQLPASLRRGWSLEHRAEETRKVAARFQDPATRRDVERRLQQSLRKAPRAVAGGAA